MRPFDFEERLQPLGVRRAALGVGDGFELRVELIGAGGEQKSGAKEKRREEKTKFATHGG